MTRPPILIAGAGIAGMTLALALARRGITTRVHERRPRLSEAGAGIQIGPNGMHVLRRLGVEPRLAPTAGRPRSIVVHHGASGRRLATLPLGDDIAGRFGAPYLVAHRADLQAALHSALSETPEITLLLDSDVDVFEEGDGCVTVRLAAGGTDTGAALIGADGIWSMVRRRLFPGQPLPYSGKMAARTLIPTPAAGSRFATPQTGVWLGPDAHVVHYPVRADREIAVVVVVDEARPREGWGGEIDGAAVLDRISGFAPELLQILRSGRDWRVWSLYDPPALPAWSLGRVGLIGDAAHPILPFLAQGGVMAIEDAETLAGTLAATPGQPDRALARFEGLRRTRVARVQHASRLNGRIFHHRGAMALARNVVLGLASGHAMMARYDWLYGWNGDGV